MDAAHTLLKQTALFIALALFGLAPGLRAQSFSSPGNGSTVSLTSSGADVSVISTGGAITFTATLSNFQTPAGTQQWVSITGGASGTTPATVSFGHLQLGTTAGTFTATVTLHSTNPATGVANSTFTVQYVSGSGGGGGGGGGNNGTITATPNPLTVNVANGGNTTANIQLTTTSASAIPFTFTYTQTNWLQVSLSGASSVSSSSPATVSVSLNGFSYSNITLQGTITITPSSGTATSIPVSLVVGTGSGTSGTITPSPSTVSLSYTTGGTLASQFVTLSTTTGATNYTATATSGSNSWLLVNSNTSTTNSYASGLTISVGATASALGTGSYSGTVQLSDTNGGSGSITVNLTVNSGSSGLTISPSPLTMSAPIGYSSGQVPVTITSNVGGTLSVTPVNAPWLSVLSAPSSIGSGTTTIYVSASAAGYSTNQTLSGSLVITVGSQQQSIVVTFVIGTGGGGGGGGVSGFAVAPTALSFFYQVGSSRQSVAQQVIGITGLAGTNWSSSVTTSNNGTWLNLSTILARFQDDGTSSTTITIDPNGLSAATYTGTVAITNGGLIQNVSVTLTVTASPVLLPSPGAVLVNYHTGDPAPGPRSIVLSASDSSAITATATTSTPWITVNQTAGSSAFSVTVSPTGQAQGMLSGTVTVTQAGLSNSPLIIPVTLINNGGSSSGNGLLTLNPIGLTFNAVVNGASPAAQTISVTAATSTTFSVGASTTSGGNWLVASVTGGITPATITIFVNSVGLALGTYNGTITFSANGTNQTVPVVLNVSTTGSGGGNITSDHTSLSFTAQTGSNNPSAQTVNITSTGSTAVGVLVSTTTANGVNWLSTGGVTSGTTPLAIPVSVSIGSMAAGTYTGSILVSPGSGGTSVTITVTLTVTAPTVSASPTSLTFSYRAGDAAPAPQNISVTGGTGLAFTATATSSGWLGISPTSGTTPGTIAVSITPAGLNASTTPYNGTITVSGAGSAVGTTTITVSLTVTAPLPTVSKVTNAGSFLTATSVSPGEIITLFASDAQHPIGPSTPVGLTLDSTGKVATTIGGVQVLAGGFACPMIYASATQVSAVVPYELALFTNRPVDVFVKYVGLTSNAVSLTVATTQPGLFTLNSSGTGPGAILNSNGTVNSPSNPAAKGDVVVIYMTGEGQTTPAGVTGKVTTVGSPPQYTPTPLLPIAILIGPSGSQQAANYIYAGEAPGFVSGAMQLNVVVPTTVNSGDQQIIVSVGQNSSQAGVTVSVR